MSLTCVRRMRLQHWLGSFVVSAISLHLASGVLGAGEKSWRVGIAKAEITPESPMYMAGFGGRDKAAEGTLHDIWVKALALEDANGYRGVVITCDVCGVSKKTYEKICDELKKRCGLERSQILLTYSHTHTGPALDECLQDYSDWDDAARTRIRDYTRWLEKTIVETTVSALAQMTPATLWIGEVTSDFAINRRNNKEADVPAIRSRGERLNGPVDHSVPMLAVKMSDGRLRTVLFGYACHTSTLNILRWSGDYAGFAMTNLEKSHPDSQAMFFQGCGGDQGAAPRFKVELTRQYGDMLSAAVEEAMRKPMKPLAPTLRTAFEFVDLPFERTMSIDDLKDYERGGGLYGRWAQRMRKTLAAGEAFPKSYPYAVQAWKLGNDQLWISMGGEPVVDYALKFKALYGPGTWVNGFSHDLTAYIPSRRVWNEGGYEGGFLGEYGLPAMRWAPDLEDRITAAVARLVEKVK
jgi:neutral ceramidase